MTEKKRYPSDKQDQYIVRFPDGMRDRLKTLAAGNGRSLNAEIIHRLQTTLEMDEYEPGENVHADLPPSGTPLTMEVLDQLLDRLGRIEQKLDKE